LRIKKRRFIADTNRDNSDISEQAGVSRAGDYETDGTNITIPNNRRITKVAMGVVPHWCRGGLHRPWSVAVFVPRENGMNNDSTRLFDFEELMKTVVPFGAAVLDARRAEIIICVMV
jgi:hypothetical protein